MGSLIEELRRREAAARAEANRLRSRIEELSEDRPGRRSRPRGWRSPARKSRGCWKSLPPRSRPPGRTARRRGDRGRRSPVGAVTVPPWQEGSAASVLPQSYQDLLEVAADAGRPLRAGEFAAAAGLAADKAKVEGLRSKLELLASRGWLAPVPGGLFVLPDHARETAKPGR